MMLARSFTRWCPRLTYATQSTSAGTNHHPIPRLPITFRRSFPDHARLRQLPSALLSVVVILASPSSREAPPSGMELSARLMISPRNRHGSGSGVVAGGSAPGEPIPPECSADTRSFLQPISAFPSSQLPPLVLALRRISRRISRKGIRGNGRLTYGGRYLHALVRSALIASSSTYGCECGTHVSTADEHTPRFAGSGPRFLVQALRSVTPGRT